MMTQASGPTATRFDATCDAERPTVLLVPDIGGPGRGHWQASWARTRPDCRLVDLGPAGDPIRNVWLSRLDQAVHAVPGPVVFAAHGLGCLAVAWWGALLGRQAQHRARGALLVAPDVTGGHRFGPAPTAMLPFPSIVAAGGEEARASRALAGEWVSDFVALEPASRLGAWRAGETLLELLIEGGPGLSRYAYRPEPPLPPAGRPVRPAPRPVSQRL